MSYTGEVRKRARGGERLGLSCNGGTETKPNELGRGLGVGYGYFACHNEGDEIETALAFNEMGVYETSFVLRNFFIYVGGDQFHIRTWLCQYPTFGC